MTTRTPKRSAKSPEDAVSDEAAAYISDALMELALKFRRATHFAQIRRHYQSITPTRGGDASEQLDLFGETPPF